MASRKGYITTEEALKYTGVTVTDDEVSRAEDHIDSIVGYHEPHFDTRYIGQPLSVGANTLALSDNGGQWEGFFRALQIEIIDGPGRGQTRTIQSNDGDGVLTLEEAWDPADLPTTDSTYNVHQAGKFPRWEDTIWEGGKVYPAIPEAVKRAVAYQAAYIHTMPDLNTEIKESENIGGYSYSRGKRSVQARLSAPKALTALRGYINRKGQWA